MVFNNNSELDTILHVLVSHASHQNQERNTSPVHALNAAQLAPATKNLLMVVKCVK